MLLRYSTEKTKEKQENMYILKFFLMLHTSHCLILLQKYFQNLKITQNGMTSLRQWGHCSIVGQFGQGQ